MRKWLRLQKLDRGMSHFSRLFWFNSILVLIATVIPLVFYQNHFIAEYEQEINTMNDQTVQQIAFTIDQQYVKETLETASRYFSEIESNEVLVYPLLHDIRGSASRILGISTRMKDIVTSLDFVDSMDVYYVNNQMYFANGHACSTEVESCMTEDRKRIVEFDKQVEWMAPRKVKDSGKNIITYIRGIPFFTPAERRQGVLAIHINEEFIRNKLEQIRPPSSGQFVILNKDGQIMTSNGDIQDELKQQLSDIFQNITTKTLGKTIDIQGNKHVWSSLPSAINDWTYVSIVNVDQLYKNSHALRNYLMLIGALLLIINFIVAFFMTRKATKPIASLINNYSMRITGLQETIDHNSPILKQHILASLLNGDSIHNPNLEKEQELLGISLHNPRAISFIIHVGEREEMAYEQILVQDFTLIDMINGLQKAMNIYAIRHQDGRVFGILNYREQSDASEVFHSLTDQMGEFLSAPLTICTGGSHMDGLHGYAHSYVEAEAAKKYLFLYPQTKLLQYEELRITERLQAVEDLTFIDRYEEVLRSGDTIQLENLFESLKEQLHADLYTVEAIKSWLDATTVKITSIFKRVDSPDAMLGYSFQEYYSQLSSLSNTLQWLKDIAKTYISHVKGKEDRSHNEFDQKIRAFIEDNLYNQISLELLAEHVAMSPTYLSKIFKEYTGQTFTDYVTDLKMEHAVQFIREKKLNVQEISTKLGYNSTHYFIKKFKERYGLTPKQYQKLQ